MAVDNISNQMVAIKISLPVNGTMKCVMEAAHTHMCQGNGIIKLQDVFASPTIIILVLEYMRETLFRFMLRQHQTNFTLPWDRDGKSASLQLWTGLKRIHDVGLAHLDIHSNNILVEPGCDLVSGDSLTLKICDFGMSEQVIPGEPSAVSLNLFDMRNKPPELALQPTVRWLDCGPVYTDCPKLMTNAQALDTWAAASVNVDFLTRKWPTTTDVETVVIFVLEHLATGNEVIHLPAPGTLRDIMYPSALAVPPGIEVKVGSKTDAFNELLAPYKFLRSALAFCPTQRHSSNTVLSNLHNM